MEQEKFRANRESVTFQIMKLLTWNDFYNKHKL